MATPAFLQTFIDGPKLPKLILGFLGLAAIGAGGWFLMLAPAQVEITALEDRRQQLATELATARAQVAELQRFRREVAELQAKLDVLKAKLPTEKETPALYRAVSEAAQGAGLGVSLFQPKEPKPKDYVAEIPITIVAEGGYHQVGQFFEKVAGLDRVVKVAELKLIGLKASKSVLRAEMTLATYMYRDAPPAGRAGAPTPATPTPGAPAPAAPKPAAALPSKEARS
jgi:type IV pilus assembly protein PilO